MQASVGEQHATTTNVPTEDLKCTEPEERKHDEAINKIEEIVSYPVTGGV